MQIDSQVISVTGSEPVTVNYVKNYIRQDYSTDDAIIEKQIRAARQIVEKYTDSSLVDKTLKVQFYDFQEYDYESGKIVINLPFPPIKSITAVAYLDADANEVAITNYKVLGLTNKRLEMNRSGSLTSEFADVYNVTMTVGMSGNVPDVLGDAIAKIIAHLYELRGVAVFDMSVADIPLDIKDMLKPYRKTFI